MVPVQTGSETVSGNMGMPRLETKGSGIFGKIPDLDRDHGVWSGPDRVPISPGPNFPNINPVTSSSSYSNSLEVKAGKFGSSEVSWNWLQLMCCAYLQSRPGYLIQRSQIKLPEHVGME